MDSVWCLPTIGFKVVLIHFKQLLLLCSGWYFKYFTSLPEVATTTKLYIHLVKHLATD